MAADLRSLEKKEIEVLVENISEPKFRADQIFQWVHKHCVEKIDEMTNLPKELKSRLEERAEIAVPQSVERQVSKVDSTVKLLLEYADGQNVEVIIMPHLQKDIGCTVCISTQVGCSIGCDFCATGKSGFERDLTVGEILSQVYAAGSELKNLFNKDIFITNVVFMGMGEPLLNYEEVLKAVRILNDPSALNISQRKMVVSTAGYVPGIYRLADEKMQVVLAVSLHTVDNKIRDRIVPLNKKYPVEKLAEACSYYTDVTGRRITFEYAMIKDINDSDECAEELADFVRPLRANVNIIPLNSVEDSKYRRSGEKRIDEFVSRLKKQGVEAVIRQERGTDLQGACGQLRLKNRTDNGLG